ncbi:hypothetical protein PR048_007098 [Dryococelus australis]|uniref:Uncharacterized protein n=1 Tax=Dryococelus australis TaxID=614101 RepID=A0ABQ9IDW8_9NEOP|nr:hypothetical protein PR048_007098 [Dryococelus australis]
MTVQLMTSRADDLKPEIITFYNCINSGLCATHDVSRETRHWSMVVLFAMLTIAGRSGSFSRSSARAPRYQNITAHVRVCGHRVRTIRATLLIAPITGSRAVAIGAAFRHLARWHSPVPACTEHFSKLCFRTALTNSYLYRSPDDTGAADKIGDGIVRDVKKRRRGRKLVRDEGMNLEEERGTFTRSPETILQAARTRGISKSSVNRT